MHATPLEQIRLTTANPRGSVTILYYPSQVSPEALGLVLTTVPDAAAAIESWLESRTRLAEHLQQRGIALCAVELAYSEHENLKLATKDVVELQRGLLQLLEYVDTQFPGKPALLAVAAREREAAEALVNAGGLDFKFIRGVLVLPD